MRKLNISFLLCAKLFLLIGCVHVPTPAENISSLERGEVAAIISGCELMYIEHNMILKNEERTASCTTEWRKYKNENNKEFNSKWGSVGLDGYTSIQFVEPGDYNFYGIYADLGARVSVSYYNSSGKPSNFLTDITVKGGEVIYIGDFVFDTRETNLIMHSLDMKYYVLDYYKNDFLPRKGYASIAKKIQKRHVVISDGLKFVREYMPVLEK
ncbi:MAG: hypothetical protein AABY27_04820 [Pseudomonadota bacterium]